MPVETFYKESTQFNVINNIIFGVSGRIAHFTHYRVCSLCVKYDDMLVWSKFNKIQS